MRMFAYGIASAAVGVSSLLFAVTHGVSMEPGEWALYGVLFCGGVLLIEIGWPRA